MGMSKQQQEEILLRYRNGESSEMLARVYGISGSAVRALLKRRGVDGRSRELAARKYSCDQSFFSSINSEEKAYWLGFIAADGNIYENCLGVFLSAVDRDHLVLLAASLHVLYARVSCHEQKEDLQRQVQQLEQWALLARTGQKTLTDIGSGLNTERKNLQRLLALVQDYQVAEVVVTFSDRLTRFGLSYLRSLFSGYGVTLTVLHPDNEQTPAPELMEDLLAIIASFAGRLYGVRSRKQKAVLSCAKQVLAEQES